MSVFRKRTEERFLIDWMKDLSTCTPAEIRERWSAPERRMIDRLDPDGFDKRLENHNPIYFVSEQVFFNGIPNAIKDTFLYPPFHRDVLCRAALAWILNETPFKLDIPKGLEGLITGTTEVDDMRALSGFIFKAPRDTYKSTHFHGAVPLFYALRHKHINGMDSRIALLHHKDGLAYKNLRRLRIKSTRSRWMKHVWPTFSGSSLRQIGSNKGLIFPCAMEGGQSEYSVEAAGMGGSITGGHYDLICISDMVTEDHKKSKLNRDETANRFDALRFVSDTNIGKIIIDGTPYHPHDQYKRLEAVETGEGVPSYFTIKCHATDKWPDRPKDPVPDDARLLHPYKWTVKRINKMRNDEVKDPRGDGKDTSSRLQINCDDVASSTVVTDPAWYQECSREEITDAAWSVLIVDPAWKGTHNQGEGDSAALEVWSYETRGDLMLMYLVDGLISNELTAHDGRIHAMRLMKKYGVIDVAPESIAGFAWATDLEHECVSYGVPCNVIRLQSTRQAKPQRIVTFLGRMQQRHVFVCTECDGDLKYAFKEQFLNFPECMGSHDDALDAAAYTCDPAIMDEYAPVNAKFAARRRGIQPWMRSKAPLPMRTRYQGF
jgi:hypothetical protein